MKASRARWRTAFRTAGAGILVTYSTTALIVAGHLDKGVGQLWKDWDKLRFDPMLGGWALFDFFVLLGGVYLAQDVFRRLLKPRDELAADADPQPRQALIVFLSNLPPGPEMNEKDPLANGLRNRGEPLGVSLTGELTADLEALAHYKRDCAQSTPPKRPELWSWEQPLRALLKHCQTLDGSEARLRYVVLIASERSYPQVHLFRRMLLQYREFQDLEVSVIAGRADVGAGPLQLVPVGDERLSGTGIDFDEFGEVVSALNFALRTLQRERHLRDRDIVVDATGGTKPATMAAAAVTMNRDLAVQYVSTNPVEVDDVYHYPVWTYDLHV